MRSKVELIAGFILFLVLIQTTLLEYVKIYNVKPNLLLVFIVYMALLRGSFEGAVIGFATGLAQDFASGKAMGFYSILGMLLGMIIGSVNKRLYRENILVIIFFNFISTIFYEFIVLITYKWGTLLSNAIAGKFQMIAFAFTTIILPEAVYNCVAAILLYIFMMKLNRKIESL